MFGQFDVAAEGVGKLELAWGFAVGFEEFGAGDEDAEGFGAGGGDVEAVEAVQKLHAARGVFGG